MHRFLGWSARCCVDLLFPYLFLFFFQFQPSSIQRLLSVLKNREDLEGRKGKVVGSLKHKYPESSRSTSIIDLVSVRQA